ncbi:replication initiation protein [Lentibacillus cibarius]|uniref:Replication initiation protein n=1 Tax=Lentibacillus cibarius TaxID=2583219 RepID=A0A549Y8V5_9BACI|nr:replication initiation protein [Lentibacillus cibarius]TRM08321.1 replication initiation protein [Lentibacillus cibarius]TRM08330.1 replication initiation protein [Lentibacillus cibarius]
MARKNSKKQLFDNENSIKKSNELSMAKLSHGLTLNQMQLLAYAIYATQQDGKTQFHKVDFEKKFSLTKYNTEDAYQDSDKITSLKFSVEDLNNNKFRFQNVFSSMEYDNGLFIFEWNPKMVTHILELKEKYVLTDLTITAQFKSSYSWILYDYLRAHYGYWHKPLSKETLMKLFGVENVKTYQNNTARFKYSVLDFAIKEINEYTELEVKYKEEKQGRKIVGFDLIWSSGIIVKSATKKQIKELKTVVDMILEDGYRFADLNDADNREHAISMVREIESMVIHTQEPICITKDRADKLMFKAQDHLRILHNYLELENQPRKRKDVYYDWINDA